MLFLYFSLEKRFSTHLMHNKFWPKAIFYYLLWCWCCYVFVSRLFTGWINCNTTRQRTFTHHCYKSIDFNFQTNLSIFNRICYGHFVQRNSYWLLDWWLFSTITMFCTWKWKSYQNNQRNSSCIFYSWWSEFSIFFLSFCFYRFSIWWSKENLIFKTISI